MLKLVQNLRHMITAIQGVWDHKLEAPKNPKPSTPKPLNPKPLILINP